MFEFALTLTQVLGSLHQAALLLAVIWLCFVAGMAVNADERS